MVEHVNGDSIKFGITSGTGRIRLATHARAGYSRVVLLRAGLPGDIAPQMERAVMATLALAAEQPMRGREYFAASALPVVLDVTGHYPVIDAVTEV